MVPGTQQVREAIRAGRVRFAIVANDLTATGLDKVVPALENRGVAHTVRYRRVELGRAVGRSPLAVVGVVDGGFARRLEALLAEAGDAT